MLTKYSFDIASLPNHVVNSDALVSEIRTSNISGVLDCVNTSDGICDVWFQDTLNEIDVALLNALMSNHSGLPSTQSVVSDSIRKAMDFGRMLIVEYGTKNVLRGYTVSQIREIAIKLEEVQNLLLSGSLYCAKQAAVDVMVDNLVTQDDKDELITKINSYLGIS